jgi:hypothetical protein
MEDYHLCFPDITIIFNEVKRGGHAARMGDLKMHTKFGRKGLMEETTLLDVDVDVTTLNCDENPQTFVTEF